MMNGYPQMELNTSQTLGIKNLHQVVLLSNGYWKIIVSRSFKACALNILVDGSIDDAIRCFKADQLCEKGF